VLKLVIARFRDFALITGARMISFTVAFAGLMFTSGSATTPGRAMPTVLNKKGRQDMQKLQSSMQTMAAGVVLKGDAAPSADVLSTILTEMENLEKHLLSEHEADQSSLDDHVAGVNCNAEYLDDEEVAASDSTVIAARTAHSECRLKENKAFKNMTTFCRTDVNTKNTALAAMPTAPTDISFTLSYMDAVERWLADHKGNVAFWDDCCKKGTSWYETVGASCDNKQIAFETDVCVQREAVNSACKSLVTCYARSTGEFERLAKRVEVEEKEREVILTSAKKVTCFIQVINGSVSQASLDSCLSLDAKTNTLYLSSTTNDLIISVPSLPEPVECNRTLVMEVPGDTAWYDKEYAGFVADRLQPVTVCSVPLYDPPSKYGGAV